MGYGPLSNNANFYDPTRQGPVAPSRVSRPENATIGRTNLFGHNGLSAWLFVENLNQNRWENGQLAAFEVIGLWGVNVARPRSFGVRVRMDFK